MHRVQFPWRLILNLTYLEIDKQEVIHSSTCIDIALSRRVSI